MAESLIGRKVRLTGEEWDRLYHNDPTYDRGTVHTIIADRGFTSLAPGCVGIKGLYESATFYVAIDDQAYASDIRDWAGELLPQSGAAEVRPYAVGFLDALLDLEPQDAGEEYDRGYSRGLEARPVTM